MNLIIAIISFVLCGSYFKESWKRKGKMFNVVIAVLWMICGIIFSVNFIFDLIL